MKLTGVKPELANFCAARLQREPQLFLACQFSTPGGQRERFLATQVLLRELCEAAVALSDARVAEAKLAWWVEEAVAWASGSERHPLAHGFSTTEAATELAVLTNAVLEWLHAPSPSTLSHLDRWMTPIGEQLARLSGEPADAKHWRMLWFACALRLAAGANAQLASVIPLDLLARHGRRRSDWLQADAVIVRAIIADCATHYPLPLERARTPALRALLAVEQRWLARLARGADPSAQRVGIFDTFAAWRAARAQ